MDGEADSCQHESYIPHPVSIPVRQYFRALVDDVEGFRILLEDEAGFVYKISYDFVLAYRKSSEGRRFKSLGMMKGDGVLTASIVYKVIGSEFLEWIESEMLGVERYRERGLQHWTIVSLDEWIDLLSFDEPVIDLLEKEQ